MMLELEVHSLFGVYYVLMKVFTRWLLTLCLMVGLVACGFATPPIISQPGTTTTIIMVRHAERDPGYDPPLNTEGLARAQKLADVLGQNGVTAIYATDYERNRQTAAPLATKLGLTVGLIAVTELTNTGCDNRKNGKCRLR
jgi:Histidine phosphatase superfamily (branch 1)